MTKVLFVAALLPFMLACTGGQTGTSGSTAPTDSVCFNFEDDQIVCNIKADVPSPELALAVGEWLDEQLGGCYDGDARDMQALIDFYGHAWSDTLRNAAEEVLGMITEFDATMEKDYETDRFVTYTLNTCLGLGGAHPTSSVIGVTFRKSDGRRLDWDIVRNYFGYRIKEIIKDKLTDYFEVGTDEELEECLFEIPAYNIPLPQTPPFFTENGVSFIYQQYEISAYAYGMPNDVIPYDTIHPLLTGQAKRLIEGL